MKIIKFLIAIILVGGLIWYFFIKPHDYIITFEVKTSPGALYSGVEEWNFLNEKRGVFYYKIKEKKPFTNIDQTLWTDSISLKFDWNFSSLNDSVTKVKIGITEKENSIYNRITAPFSNTLFKQTIIDMTKDFKDGIDYQLKYKFKVAFGGKDSISETAYAYISIKNVHLRDKAKEMMKNNATLLNYITKYKIKNANFPFLIVESWDFEKNRIDFRYCFPIKEKDSLPSDSKINFDKLSSKKALKAIYNGNFITSDRGWFYLHEYAERNALEIENTPIEFFYNNPFSGGDELQWKTEVFIPIK